MESVKQTTGGSGESMVDRVRSTMNIRQGEGPGTAKLFGLIFSLTISFALAKSAQQGIFLAEFPRERIPDAFMISAALLAVTSFLSSALVARLGPVRLLSALLPGIAGVLVIVRFSFEVLPAGELIVYAVVEASIGLLLAQAWAVTGEVFDVRSAKRLLPLVGIAASIGWMAGGFGAAPLAGSLGTPALLLLSAGAMLVGFGLVLWITRVELAGRAGGGAQGDSLWDRARGGVSAIRQTPLLRVLAVVTMCGLVLEMLLDYQLFTEVQIRFGDDQSRIASLAGMLYGGIGAAGVIFQFLLSGRVLTRYGSSKSSLSAPAVALVGSLVFLISPGLVAIVLTRGGYSVLKQSLASPARAQLQGALSGVTRAQSGALLKGVLAPLVYAVAALGLKLVGDGLDLRVLSIGIVLIAAASVGASARWLRAAYVEALRASIDSRRLDFGTIQTENRLTPEHYQLLAEEADGPAERAELAAIVATTGSGPDARSVLRRSLDHPAVSVRVRAIEGLRGLGDETDAPRMAEILTNGSDPDERLAALSTLVAFKAADAAPVLSGLLSDDEPPIRALAAAHLAAFALDSELGSAFKSESGSNSGRESDSGGQPTEDSPGFAVAQFEALLTSCSAEERRAAAWAITEVSVDHTAVYRAIRLLLSDDETLVRRQAVRAATRLDDQSLIRSVVHALGDQETVSDAFAAFRAIDDLSTDEVERSLDDASVLIHQRTAAALAGGHGPNGEELLHHLLDNDDVVIGARASRSLGARRRRAGLVLSPEDHVLPVLEREVAIAYRYYGLLIGLARLSGHRDYEVPAEFDPLATEIWVRIRQTDQRIFGLLGLIANPATVRTSELSRRLPDARSTARFVELLEHNLDEDVARTVVPVLDRRPLRMREAELVSRSDRRFDDPIVDVLSIGDRHLADCALACAPERLTNLFPDTAERADVVIPLVQRMHFLRRMPLFADLTGEELMQVAEIATLESFPAGTVIFYKGDPGDVMYLVMRGTVVMRDGDLDIATIGVDEFFGEFAVLDDEARSATAVCVAEADLLTISGADLDELVERRSGIARALIRVLVRRLREANTRLA